mgnify:CR=1 FL=1
MREKLARAQEVGGGRAPREAIQVGSIDRPNRNHHRIHKVRVPHLAVDCRTF